MNYRNRKNLVSMDRKCKTYPLFKWVLCVINSTWLQKALKQKLDDIFIQNWNSQVQSTSESNIYKIYKTDFEQSKIYMYLFYLLHSVNHLLDSEQGITGYPLRLVDRTVYQ